MQSQDWLKQRLTYEKYKVCNLGDGYTEECGKGSDIGSDIVEVEPAFEYNRPVKKQRSN
jgi:hypothetical protein